MYIVLSDIYHLFNKIYNVGSSTQLVQYNIEVQSFEKKPNNTLYPLKCVALCCCKDCNHVTINLWETIVIQLTLIQIIYLLK